MGPDNYEKSYFLLMLYLVQVEKRTNQGIVFVPIITILTVSLLVYDIANTISVNDRVLHTVLHVKHCLETCIKEMFLTAICPRH